MFIIKKNLHNVYKELKCLFFEPILIGVVASNYNYKSLAMFYL